MSAEIQTSLFILTAEVAGVTTLVAMGAGVMAMLHRKARIKAAEALRAAAKRLPGEGDLVERERALLGEFARAYLTRDADVLAALPAQLLSLRQACQAAQAPAEAADTSQTEAVQAELSVMTTRAEASEQALKVSAKQLDGSLATINTLVQEYGRGRGQVVTPTAEALLQALLQLGQTPPAKADNALGTSAQSGMEVIDLFERDEDEASEHDSLADTSPVAEQRGAMSDDEIIDLAANGDAETQAPSLAEPDLMADEDDIDALLAAAQADLPGAAEKPAPARVEETKDPAMPDEKDIEPMSAPPARPVEEPQDMDFSIDAEPVQQVPAASEPSMDALDDLDIDALLDAELGRQSKLLHSVTAAEEDMDLSRIDESDHK